LIKGGGWILSSVDFLARLGILVRHGFLSADICERIVAGIRSGETVQAGVGGPHGDYVVDESVRRASAAEVGEETLSLVEAPLGTLKPSLEEHFQVALSGYESPSFLYYKIGDHYRPHRDSRPGIGGDSKTRIREVSVVVFLNDASEGKADSCYGGGELTFFGLMKAPGMEVRGLPLAAEKGLLVAFRSDLIHQVTPVTHGERFTMVTWYASSLLDQKQATLQAN
jgi:predicted 2-oxoglutarate/Fe(II)-dependent dioxygenase YbiX